MRFIDLFAGLGGFHLALSKLGHECVFASEIKPYLRETYEKNFNISPHGDIKELFCDNIPSHDILTAGFPCQSFSKAGDQRGLNDFRGTLFDDITRIIKFHKPKYFILENVANLKNHDSGRTWDIMYTTLTEKLGYNVKEKKLSPHHFGIPQIRDRIFIVGSSLDIDYFEWPRIQNIPTDISSVLDTYPENAKFLPDRELECLEIWQEFLQCLPSSCKLPSFPIWSMEFGCTYPYKNTCPFNLSKHELSKFKGSFGMSLEAMSKSDQLARIPKYARERQRDFVFPKWKLNFIRNNRQFYQTYKTFIDPILNRLRNLPPSWQKLEWNCQGESRDIYKYILQFRGSGLRIKRRNFSPSLVASSSTQIPIIGWEKRYITIQEGKRLQCLEELKYDPDTLARSYTALGNAVNAKIVMSIAKNLIKCDSLKLKNYNSLAS
jgi:DNA (cytosine-5)-methyltransferase 1